MSDSFGGFARPTTTPVPDELIDSVMHLLTGSELKVVLYIIRRTFGFKKTSDDIALDQICGGIVKHDGERLDYGTGLSRETAVKAIRGLVQKGIIVQTKHGPAPSTYQLRFEGDAEPDIPALRKKSEKPTSDQATKPEAGEKSDSSMPEVGFSDPQEVGFSDPQQTDSQQTDSQETERYVTTAVSKTLDVSGPLAAVVVPDGDQDREGEGETPNPEPDMTPEAYLARWLVEADVTGPRIDPTTHRCRDLIAKVARRSEWAEEVNDILGYAEERRLGAGWVIERMTDLARVSPNTRKGFRWGDYSREAQEATYA